MTKKEQENDEKTTKKQKRNEVIQRFELWSTGSKPVILTTIRYHQKLRKVCRLG